MQPSCPIACLLGRWLAGGLLAIHLAAADRPQWGEAGTRNMVSEEKGLPAAFDPKTGSNILWSARLGTECYSTPVIAQGRVFLGANNAEPRNPARTGDRGVLYCFEEKTGSFLWQLVVPKIKTSIYWDWPQSGICSPATVESNRVYLVSNRGEVMSLDLCGMTNGNDGPYLEEAAHASPPGEAAVPAGPTDADIVWLLDLIKECGVRQHDSAHSSILIHGDYLYVNTANGVDDTHKIIEAPDAPSLVVLDKRTGRLVAQDGEHIGPHIVHSTWSSPALATIQGRHQILFCGGDGVVYAFEPFAPTPRPPANGIATLKKIWQFDCDPSAPKTNLHTYLNNRRESPSNIKGMPVFQDNRVFVTGGGDVWWGKEQCWVKCLNPVGAGNLTRTAEAWSSPLERHCLTTPAVADGLVFVGDTGKRFHCLDAATGRPHWTHDAAHEFWASPLVADGKVFAATRGGDLLVFAAAKEKTLLGQTRLGEPISATPVAANGVLYLATRRWLHAVAIGAPSPRR